MYIFIMLYSFYLVNRVMSKRNKERMDLRDSGKLNETQLKLFVACNIFNFVLFLALALQSLNHNMDM